MSARSLSLEQFVTPDSYHERGYLDANPDVRAAIRKGVFKCGREHFDAFGFRERRKQQIGDLESLSLIRAEKLARLRPMLRTDLPVVERDGRLDYITAELRHLSGIEDTDNSSANEYDNDALALIHRLADGLVLDCGAGRRSVYFENVVNLEIVNYLSTDVLAIGEVLPFKDNTFDGILSIAVLEHVKNPFRAAAELVRVLKPGGTLICAVPFLQPVHGFPHHYFNMTHQGLRSLLGDAMEIESESIPDGSRPIWVLNWIVQSWAAALSPAARETFLSMPIGTLLSDPVQLVGMPFCSELPHAVNVTLASGIMTVARKVGSPTT